MSTFGFYHELRMSDPGYRAKMWQQLQECRERQQRVIDEAEAAIRVAGPKEGDLVLITPLQVARVVSISGSPPWATVEVWLPTGRAGELCRRTEQRELRSLRPADDHQPPTIEMLEPIANDQQTDP
jgi:hypothetical protein